jgi:hypothetical protein
MHAGVIPDLVENEAAGPQHLDRECPWFKLMTMFERVHPLEGGAFRRKSWRDRRYGLPLESPFVFYPRYASEIADKARGYWYVYRKARVILKEVLSAPDRWTYSDIAIAPSSEDEFDRLDLYHATAGSEEALAYKRRQDRLRRVRGESSCGPSRRSTSHSPEASTRPTL